MLILRQGHGHFLFESVSSSYGVFTKDTGLHTENAFHLNVKSLLRKVDLGQCLQHWKAEVGSLINSCLFAPLFMSVTLSEFSNHQENKNYQMSRQLGRTKNYSS